MITRRVFVVFGGSLLAAPALLRGQDKKMRRIGFLAARSRSDVYYDAFLQGMKELGYVEGKNITIEWRFADNRLERLPELTAELVKANIEVLVTHGNQNSREAQKATKTIPIVIAALADPVGAGIVSSIAKPGGNTTGLAIMSAELGPKQIELLHAVVPRLNKIAMLVNPLNTGHANILKSTQAAGRSISVNVFPVEARSPETIEPALAHAARERAQVLIVAVDTVFIGQRRKVIELAARHKLATMHAYREDVQAGALISYGQNLADFYRRAATYVDKILKGAKPGDLPIEQPARIHLAVNRKTAKTLGFAISKELELRADEVIE